MLSKSIDSRRKVFFDVRRCWIRINIWCCWQLRSLLAFHTTGLPSHPARVGSQSPFRFRRSCERQERQALKYFGEIKLFIIFHKRWYLHSIDSLFPPKCELMDDGADTEDCKAVLPSPTFEVVASFPALCLLNEHKKDVNVKVYFNNSMRVAFAIQRVLKASEPSAILLVWFCEAVLWNSI